MTKKFGSVEGHKFASMAFWIVLLKYFGRFEVKANEFELIDNYFAAQNLQRADVNCGIGDDAAIVTPPSQQQIVITTDTLVA